MKGFTLIELLVVVVMMGILTSVALPQYRRSLDRAKVAEAAQMLPAIYEARERWMIENGLKFKTDSLGRNIKIVKMDGGEEVSVEFGKLDIQSKGVASGRTLTTNNFVYDLLNDSKLVLISNKWVSAKPRWGVNRIKDKVTLYYGGDKMMCAGSGTEAKAICERLNVEYVGLTPVDPREFQNSSTVDSGFTRRNS